MNSKDPAPPTADSVWAKLRALTPARIGLARAGASLAATAVLELRAAHAAARDAVWTPLDGGALLTALTAIGPPGLSVASRATDRQIYLMRPDFGRLLDAESARRLNAVSDDYDLAIILADGLSATAVQRHAPPLLATLLPALRGGWRIAPPVVAEGARVALGDEIALALGATSVLVLIGERPGLSATDSLGAYFTWGVKPGVTDADRNCVSNIRPEGVGYEEATREIIYLLNAARKGGYSGVNLKNRSDDAQRLTQSETEAALEPHARTDV